jgi:hypothetical protein
VSTRRTAGLWLGLLGGALLLSSCIVNNGVRVNWSSSVSAHSYSARYATFSGTSSVPISINESQVVFDYQATVDRGRLSIKLNDPQGKEVWSTTLTRSGSGTRTVAISRFGSYSLTLEGQDTGGGFEVRWQ